MTAIVIDVKLARQWYLRDLRPRGLSKLASDRSMPEAALRSPRVSAPSDCAKDRRCHEEQTDHGRWPWNTLVVHVAALLGWQQQRKALHLQAASDCCCKALLAAKVRADQLVDRTTDLRRFDKALKVSHVL